MSEASSLQLEHLVAGWTTASEDAIERADGERLKSLLDDPVYFRDNGAITWDFRQFHGAEAAIDALVNGAAHTSPQTSGCRQDGRRPQSSATAPTPVSRPSSTLT